MNIVLHEPEIPANTGNIGRSCVATGSRLHLIEPLGFKLTEYALKRSGMDYWPRLDYVRYINYMDYVEKNPGVRVFYATTKAKRTYCDVEYRPDDHIMFGKESHGIPEEILVDNEEYCIRIPMLEREGVSPQTTPGPASDPADPDAVWLNLSNAANIVMFEALRQLGFRA